MVDNALPPLPVMPDPARTPVLGPNAAFSTEWAPYWGVGNRITRNAYARRLVGLDGDALAPQGVPPVQSGGGNSTETVFYVANGGSRKNNGLSPDDPWPDAQWAYMQIQEHWRCNGSFPIIELAEGTYGGVPAGTYNRYNDAFGVGAPFLQTTGAIGGAQFTGGGPLIIRGPSKSDWTKAVISVNGATAISILHGSVLLIVNVTIETTGPFGIFVGSNAVLEYGDLIFKGAAAAHIGVDNGGDAVSSGSYNIQVAAPSHFQARGGGRIVHRVGIGIVAPNLNFSAGFANAEDMSLIDARGSSVGGPHAASVTGLRASANWKSLIRNGTGLPGSGVFQDNDSLID